MRARTAFPIIIVLILPLLLLAQEPESTSESRLTEPAVSYEIHGKINAPTRQIVATADIDIHYASDTNAIWIRLPDRVEASGKGDRFILDSVLINGAPASLALILQSERYLHFDNSTLPPGRVHLLVSFSTKFTANMSSRRLQTVHIRDWYPQVVTAPYMGKNPAQSDYSSPVVANYAVGLSVDPAFLLAGAGELRNEREHFGTLPNYGDTVLFDVAANALGQPVRGISSTSSYAWEASRLGRFDIALIAGGPTIDQAVAGTLRLTIYNGSQSTRQNRWRQDIAEAGQRLLKYFQSKLGTPPNASFEAVWTDGASFDRLGNGLITLPAQSRNKSVAIAALAVQLAGQYFSPTVITPESRGLPWTDGVAVYAATEALHDLYGAKGYSMIAEFGDWEYSLTTIGQPTARRSPFAWVETIRAPRVHRSLQDSLTYEALFVVPSALHTFEPIFGGSRAWTLLRDFQTRTRHRAVTADEFVSFMADPSRTFVTPDMFEQWETYNRRFDWSVKDVSVQKTYSGVVLTGRIERSALPLAPLELGIVVPSGDTLSKSLMPDSSDAHSKYLSFNIEVLDTPVALILDPYHYLPDMNRENNAYLFGHGPVRLSTGKLGEYPAFRRLVRGE